MHIRWIIVLVSTLLCSLLAWGAEAAALPSLLSNPDFSLDRNGDQWPDDWPREKGMSWETEDGRHFLRLRVETPGQMLLAYRRIDFPTPPPAALELRFRLRYTDVQHGKENWNDARFFAHFKNAAGRDLLPEPVMPYYLGTSKGWVDYTAVVKVPKGAAYLELMPVLFQVSRGTLDIALCQVLPATAYLLPAPEAIASTPWLPAKDAVLPPELHVDGNQLKTPDGKAVWLQGLCVDSLEWSAGGERIEQSIPVAIEQWKANVIRLPLAEKFWFGRGPYQAKDGGIGYRKIVDAAVEAVVGRGAYIALDLHGFGAPFAKDAAFWRDVATRYRNHPAVLFELFNEPHTVTWKEWRDGGLLPEESMIKAANDEEALSPGMQGLLDTVRATGARNIVIAGGLDWGYDLSGIAQEFALLERAGGNGIIYSSHIYPWKTGWQAKVLVAAEKYPLFIGEVGCPKDWKGFEFIPPAARISDLDQWPVDVLGMIQQHKLNWTGFSFHPTCGPNVISDWQFTPTPYWGAYVKEALEGTRIEGKRMR